MSSSIAIGFFILVLTAALLSFAPVPAFAGDEAAADEDVEVGEVEVEGDKPQAADTLPGEDAIEVNIADLLISGGTIGSVLDTFGAVEVRGLGGGLDLTTLSLRGFGSHQNTIFLEGAPISPATGGVFDLSFIPSEMIAGAKIARGAGAISAGLSGEVNLKLRGGDAPYFDTSAASFGSFSAGGGTAWQAGQGKITLAASVKRTDGDFTYMRGDGLTYARENNARKQAAVAVAYSRGDASVSDSAVFFAMDRSGGVPGLSEFPTPLAHEDDTLLIAGFSHRDKAWRGGEATFSAYTRLAHTGFGDPSPYLGGSVYTDQTEYAGGVSGTYRFISGRDVSGVQLSLDHAALADGAYGNPTRTTASVALWREFYRGRDEFSASVSGDAATGGDLGWRGKFGWERSLGAGFSLSASVARSFRRPNFSELYYPESGFIGGNPDLAPEKGWSADFGPRYEHGGNKISLVGFAGRVSESVEFVPVSAYRIRAENTGAVRSAGVSFDASTEVAKGLTASGSFTYLDAEYLDGGLPLAGRSPRKWSFGVSRKWGRWSLSGNFLHRAATPVDRFGSLFVRASDDLSAELSAEFGQGWKLSLSGFNLLDEDLRDALDFPRPGISYGIALSCTW